MVITVCGERVSRDFLKYCRCIIRTMALPIGCTRKFRWIFTAICLTWVGGIAIMVKHGYLQLFQPIPPGNIQLDDSIRSRWDTIAAQKQQQQHRLASDIDTIHKGNTDVSQNAPVAQQANDTNTMNGTASSVVPWRLHGPLESSLKHVDLSASINRNVSDFRDQVGYLCS